VYGFITCEKWPEDPTVLSGERELHIPSELEYLRGRTFGELLEACRLGTRDALCELGRPVYEVILPELSERCIGAYMQMWMLATAYAGLLYNVNAFDQPGVERSKQLAMERLKSRPVQ
jgi:glucose-6-phosphate isomerase